MGMQSLRGAGSGFGVRGFGSAATGFWAHRLRPVRCKMRSLSGQQWRGLQKQSDSADDICDDDDDDDDVFEVLITHV